jgi:phage baseplate assembly protein gpV
VGVVPETSISYAATGSSSSTTITLTGSGLPAAIPVGTSVAYYAANGQLIETGSFVTVAANAAATSVTINAAIAVPGSVTAIPAASSIVFTVYRELLVKLNVLTHGYYSSVTA